ncbi:hypothetical protein CPB83DRAFT_911574 [Crepidotus variabilis]|uniref:CxC6 like cysteine cluster associated with KDZ domain-containing protein n=1 Tax=Crepidotus variabilis TaxID=179855 RepID=A0A9P6JI35_9AGAR|nr:hypothetical protein CPB83DRAFT_911574 [Crepidotus variabilis]
MDIDLLSLFSTLQSEPELFSIFDYRTLQEYFDFVNLLRAKISAARPSYQSGPPATLPTNVHEFLKRRFGMSDSMGKLAWETLGNFAWRCPFQSDEEHHAAICKHAKAFLIHGLPLDIGVYDLEPPTRVCIDPRCADQLRASTHILRERELVEPLTHKITIFTKSLGPLPSFSTSRYCRKCNTRYYHNFYVHSNAEMRTYYPNLPRFVQASQRFFLESDLCEFFATEMVMSWTSATNCARIYNASMQNLELIPHLPVDWPTGFELSVEFVWDAFFLYGLMLDHVEEKSVLELPHQAESQAKRLQAALRVRNQRLAGVGQEAWNHACDRCCHIEQREDGEFYQIRSTISDGISSGRPCCAVHDCKQPLESVKHHFCPPHCDKSKHCAVVHCDKKAEPGFRTCLLSDHRKCEESYLEQGKAMFQLKKRLERLKVSQTHDSVAVAPNAIADEQPEALEGVGDADDEVLVDEDGVCEGKPETGNRKVKARFGRRRTHNEQLCVGSCGVILGRATFYGSEAVNGVRTFWKKLFPTKASLPSILWFDNNCQLVSMLRTDRDTYFDGCALPVDVFHFKSKHKERDVNCGKNCNPYLWPQLRTADGKSWRFNSSAAEQTNVWFGGFQSIVREMQADRYDFFLDEMIKRRNRILIKELEKKGCAPYSIPREVLLCPDQ